MLAATVAVSIITFVLAFMTVARELARTAWGRQFSRELEICYSIPGDICEALTSELINRDDRIHRLT